jgi:hypothetical protein
MAEIFVLVEHRQEKFETSHSRCWKRREAASSGASSTTVLLGHNVKALLRLATKAWKVLVVEDAQLRFNSVSPKSPLSSRNINPSSP